MLPLLFIYFTLIEHTYNIVYIYTVTRRGPLFLPHSFLWLWVGVPSRDSNSGLPYSKPTRYYLSHAASYFVILVCILETSALPVTYQPIYYHPKQIHNPPPSKVRQLISHSASMIIESTTLSYSLCFLTSPDSKVLPGNVALLLTDHSKPKRTLPTHPF